MKNFIFCVVVIQEIEKRLQQKDFLIYRNIQDIFLNAINPFIPNAPFLYPLKTSENHKVFWCFQGAKKGCIGNEWVNGKDNTQQLKVVCDVFKNNMVPANLQVQFEQFGSLFQDKPPIDQLTG